MGDTVKTMARLSTFQSPESGKEKRARKKRRRDRVYQNAQVPDPEAIRMAERRRQAAARGSRANTVLTEDERLGG